MRERPKIKIFVTHFNKPEFIYEDSIHIPIQAGKKNSKIDLGIQGDDTGDNISDRNSQYAELTTQYRVRKNYDLSNVDYVGFCHYRRYIQFNHKLDIKKCNMILKTNSTLYNNLCELFEYIFGIREKVSFDPVRIQSFGIGIRNHIKGNKEIYLTKRGIALFTEPLAGFKHFGLKNDILWNELEKTISKQYPDYKESIKKVQNLRRANGCNIFIMKTQLFKEYSKRLFDILLSFEEVCIKNKYNEMRKNEFTSGGGQRFLGYLGEYLLNLFLIKKTNEGKSISRSGCSIFIKS